MRNSNNQPKERSECTDARIGIVDQHIRNENLHDLDAVLATFGVAARYDDEPWNDHRLGIEGVRSYYIELINALPDLSIEVQSQHVSSDGIVVEVIIRGSHLGAWRGLPATGRKIELPLCGIYTFDDDDKLAGERIYFDRGMVLRQLGVFREPTGASGRLFTALDHPITIARAYLRRS
jgi:steroid delta-isomerase-like uncharacterized protein